MFPNPTLGQFSIVSKDGSQIKNVIIKDYMGRVLSFVQSDFIHLIISSKGLYFVDVEMADGKKICRKIVVVD